MLKNLYKKFQNWGSKGAIWVISDTHFEDKDCRLMDENWLLPEEHIKLLKKYIHKNDTFIHLGDVGNLEYIKQIPGYKILIMGNHDTGITKYEKVFDEVYKGPLFISEKLLLSHEKLLGPWFNIHGHEHDETVSLHETHLNLASNVCKYIPFNLTSFLKKGGLSKIKDIHRITIDNASKNPIKKENDGDLLQKNTFQSKLLKLSFNGNTGYIDWPILLPKENAEELKHNFEKIIKGWYPFLMNFFPNFGIDFINNYCFEIMRLLLLFEKQPEIFCTYDGIWQIEWEDPQKYLEIIIDTNIQAEVFIQYNDSEEHECNSFPFWKEYFNIIDMINNFDSKEKTMKILKNLQVKYKNT